ncbi:MAG: hypothetical protein FWH14_07440, partial [Oscillospiraceae bacterium]|nr:hypothetical protein [Oscillospiraceae bacterium]
LLALPWGELSAATPTERAEEVLFIMAENRTARRRIQREKSKREKQRIQDKQVKQQNKQTKQKKTRRFDKTTVLVMSAIIVVVAGFALWFALSNEDTGKWEIYTVTDDLNRTRMDVELYMEEDSPLPRGFKDVSLIMLNAAVPDGIIANEYFTLIKLTDEDKEEWRIVPFKKDFSFDEITTELELGESKTHTIGRDMFDAKLGKGNYGIIKEVWFKDESREKESVWAGFYID